MKYYLHELPNDNLPRERLAKLGASSLSDYELLAIILAFIVYLITNKKVSLSEL